MGSRNVRFLKVSGTVSLAEYVGSRNVHVLKVSETGGYSLIEQGNQSQGLDGASCLGYDSLLNNGDSGDCGIFRDKMSGSDLAQSRISGAILSAKMRGDVPFFEGGNGVFCAEDGSMMASTESMGRFENEYFPCGISTIEFLKRVV